MTSWNKEQTTLLIQLYRKAPCLYDPHHPDYISKHKRHAAFLSISRHLESVKPNISPSEIKTKMRTIRNQFAKEKIRLAKTEDCLPKLWCYKQLTFLNNYKLATHDNDTSINQTYSDDPLIEEEHEQKEDLFEEIVVADYENSHLSIPEQKPFEKPSIDFDQTDYTEEIKKDSREAVFSRYVCHRLEKIKNEENFEEVTWRILELLRETIIKEQSDEMSI